MSQKFKFNILTGEDAPDKYAAIDPKEPFTFYLLQTGAGYLGTVKLFDASESSVMSGKFFRAVSSHIITQDDLDNENLNAPEGTEVGAVGMLFTADTDEDDNGNETYYFLPVQFKEIETVDEINHENPSDKIPTEAAVVNYVVQMLADKVSFEIDGVPGGGGNVSNGPSNGNGSNDTPVGTVISFMGTSAPQDYLICNGAEYNIDDYPELANHFQTNFGSIDYFGGDGATTFAVPDLRNMFLRGYHEDAEEQLSGEVGEKQEGTKHLNIEARIADDGNSFFICQVPFEIGGTMAQNTDSQSGSAERYVSSVRQSENANGSMCYYTSHPVNVAVLFCIRAKSTVFVAQNNEAVYTSSDGVTIQDNNISLDNPMRGIWTQEQFEALSEEQQNKGTYIVLGQNDSSLIEIYDGTERVIGTWFGKPLYRIAFIETTPSSVSTNQSILDVSDLEIEELVTIRGTIKETPTTFVPVSYYNPSATSGTGINIYNNYINMVVSHNIWTNKPVTIIVEYTKTTDVIE